MIAFSNNRAKKDGKHQWCKQCTSEYAKIKQYEARPQYKARRAAQLRQSDVRERNREQSLTRKRSHPRACLGRSLKHALDRVLTETPITIDELVDLYERQQGRCALTGIKMVWAQGEIVAQSMSIDRIDRSKGYEKSNVRLLCNCINSFRGTMCDEEMLDIARALVWNMEDRDGKAAA